MTAASTATATAGTVALTTSGASAATSTVASSQRTSGVGLHLGTTAARAATRTSTFDALRLASTSRTATSDLQLRGLEQALAATRAQGSIDVLIAQRLLALS